MRGLRKLKPTPWQRNAVLLFFYDSIYEPGSWWRYGSPHVMLSMNCNEAPLSDGRARCAIITGFRRQKAYNAPGIQQRTSVVVVVVVALCRCTQRTCGRCDSL